MILKRTATIGGRWLCKVAISSLLLCLQLPASAQTLTVIHNFNELNGSSPAGGLTMDAAGNFYGTTAGGGGANHGIVFKLARKDTEWILTPLYIFKTDDGAGPGSRVIFGPDGALYGTTSYGGTGYGTVYRLQSPTSCRSMNCPWTETILYSFHGINDGWDPGNADLAFDQLGNIYGTTEKGGACNGYCGVVFKLTRSGGSWSYSVLYSFQGGSDGAYPIAGVILDAAGNLYGTALDEGGSGGVVYQLTASGSRRTDDVLYDFRTLALADSPEGGLMFDRSGNLYGTNRYGGDYGTGTVYELSPANGGWNYTVLVSLPGPAGGGPVAALTMDGNGALYGTTLAGSVFKLTPSGSNWILTQMGSAGGQMSSGVIADSNGVIYGTDCFVGYQQNGIVFEITQ